MNPVDHLGNHFSSVSEMMRAYNIPSRVIYQRIQKLGWSLEKTLTTPVRGMKPLVYKGRTYRSTRELCLTIGVDNHTLDRRVAMGFTLEEAVELGRTHMNWTRSIDHLGNEYPSFKAMCRAYGKHPDTVNFRLDRGYSLELALTSKQLRKKKRGPYAKRTGNKSAKA